MIWEYEELKETISGHKPPLMIVDMDRLDSNIKNIKEIASSHGKKIRIASKSVRSTEILSYIMNAGSPVFQGLMCFSSKEAEFLFEKGFDDLLIAYPAVDESDYATLQALNEKNANITLMIDSMEHIESIENFWKKHPSSPLGVCIDIDMSYRPMGAMLHLGVQRSSIRTFSQFKKILNRVIKCEFLKLKGIMGYEAQIAGVGEKNPFTPKLNTIKKIMKSNSAKDVAEKRAKIGEYLERKNIPIEFFNGGGSGSLISTSSEKYITEVAAGSGFLQSQLFDYYENNKNEAAFCFALQITRIPEKGKVTCQSGGFIASGETSLDKSPTPILPHGMATIPTEGFGEVQTPLINKSAVDLKLGDPVFFRPAKAGEIAERFNEYLLIRNGIIIKRALTYRGEGKCFY